MNNKSKWTIILSMISLTLTLMFYSFSDLDRTKHLINITSISVESIAQIYKNQQDNHHVHNVHDHLDNDQIKKIQEKIKSIKYKRDQIDGILLNLNNHKPSHSRLIYPNEIKSIVNNTTINPECSRSYGQDLLVVILVISKPNDFHRRKIIRETWGSHVKKNSLVKIYFVIGKPHDQADDSIQNDIQYENHQFNDLIQFNFIDTYYNLTIKSLAMLRWSMVQCAMAKYVYKVDDDVIVNIENLISFCNDHYNEMAIWGQLWIKATLNR